MTKFLVRGLLTTGLVLSAAFAHAQQPAKVPRIGFLFVGSKNQPHLESFRQGLREFGYVEGKNIFVEYRYADGKIDALAGLAADLVAQNLALILTTTPQSSRAVIEASSTIPVVITGFDAVRIGMAKSLAQPGGNLTGLSSNSGPGIIGKRLELVKETFPNTKVVGLVMDPASETREEATDVTNSAAKSLQLQIPLIYVKNPSDIDRGFEGLKKLGVNALHLPNGPITTLNSKQLINLAAKHRVPAIYPTGNLVEDGGLMAYGVNFSDLYRRAAAYVDKILKGRKPADLPIEQPMKFELVFNLKAAQQIGVTIPPNVLARADRVIK